MTLPFTAEQFHAVFRAYNEALWPAPLALSALGVSAVLLLWLQRRWSSRAIAAILGILWLWSGILYHQVFFAAINPQADVFTAIFLLGALVFLRQGLWRDELKFEPGRSIRCICGALLIGFSLLGYPVWSSLTGHAYPELPTFGLPCPTTLFTLGMLGFAARPYPRAPLAMPVLWALIGGQAAWLLEVTPDLSLFGAAAAGILWMLRPAARPA